MAWETLEPEEENNFTKYPKFEKVGENVEGNLYEFYKDSYDRKGMVLEVGEDEEGEPLLQNLPTHAHLQRFYKKVEIGDYLRVELVKIIPPKEDQEYPTKIYKVQVDPNRKVIYEEEDDEEYFE